MPTWLLFGGRLPPRSAMLASLLLSASGTADGQPKPDNAVTCSIDNETLAFYLGTSVSAMRSYLLELVRLRLVRIMERGPGHGGPATYSVYYAATPPPDWDAPRVSARQRAQRNRAYQDLRRRLLTRYDRCLCCGATADLDVEHIRPRFQGGSDDESNLQVLCARCNSRKGSKTIDYRPAAG